MYLFISTFPPRACVATSNQGHIETANAGSWERQPRQLVSPPSCQVTRVTGGCLVRCRGLGAAPVLLSHPVLVSLRRPWWEAEVPRPFACVSKVWFWRNESGHLLGLDNQAQPGVVTLYPYWDFQNRFSYFCVIWSGSTIFQMNWQSRHSPCPLASVPL